LTPIVKVYTISAPSGWH